MDIILGVIAMIGAIICVISYVRKKKERRKTCVHGGCASCPFYTQCGIPRETKKEDKESTESKESTETKKDKNKENTENKESKKRKYRKQL